MTVSSREREGPISPPVETMTDEELAAKITAECSHGDLEMAHADADRLIIDQMRALGYTKSADAWESVGKWYA